MDTVQRIMKYATSLNSKAHYPIIAVSYGYIATMKGVSVRDAVILQVP